MSASDPKTTERKWLPWVIGIIVLLLLAWWLMGRGKAAEMGAVADTTQMMAPDTMTPPAAEPAPAPVQTATPAPAMSSPTPTDTAHAMTPHTPSRADTIRAPAKALPPPEPTGPGAMGGRGAPGKKPPATTP